MDSNSEAPKYIGAFYYVKWVVRCRLNCPRLVIQEIVEKKVEKRDEVNSVRLNVKPLESLQGLFCA